MQDETELVNKMAEESKSEPNMQETNQIQDEEKEKSQIQENTSQDPKESKIKYTIMGKDVAIDPESIVYSFEKIETLGT
jgi:hypothetical protein